MKNDTFKKLFDIIDSKKFNNLADNLENLLSETDFRLLTKTMPIRRLPTTM